LGVAGGGPVAPRPLRASGPGRRGVGRGVNYPGKVKTPVREAYKRSICWGVVVGWKLAVTPR